MRVFRLLAALVSAMFLAAAAAVAASPPDNPARAVVAQRLAQKAVRHGAGAALSGGGPEIVNGFVAPAGLHRFQVALLFRVIPSNRDAFYCGGVLVNHLYVVTAAHCSDFIGPGDVQVLTGTRRLDGSGVRRNVVAIAIHPQWDAFSFDYDVAVWRLDGIVNSSPGFTLPAADPPVGTRLTVTGWGMLGNADFPTDLMGVTVPLVTRANCNDANSYEGDVTSRMICAGYDQGGKDSCAGDSGGPLTRRLPDGRRELLGLVSWGTGCAEPNYFGVYTRVSHPSIRSFIISHTNPLIAW